MRINDDCPYIIQVPATLAPDECTRLIEKIDALQPSMAPISTPFGPELNAEVRNNERAMFDDQALADLVLERVRDKVPTQINGRTLCGANERFRCYRYKPGMRFAPHEDGSFARSLVECSYYSFLIFLNGDFEGGQTRFYTEPPIDIQPRTGLGLLFQHRIVHEGVAVETGVKYVARSDLMYRET